MRQLAEPVKQGCPDGAPACGSGQSSLSARYAAIGASSIHAATAINSIVQRVSSVETATMIALTAAMNVPIDPLQPRSQTVAPAASRPAPHARASARTMVIG